MIEVFIIHYTKLTERKKHMLNQMHLWFPKVNYKFILEFDQECLSEKIIQKNFDLELFKKRFGREMLWSEMSLCMKYKDAVRRAANSENEFSFILEDDVIFKEDPICYIDTLISFLKNEKVAFDSIFLGEAWIRKGDDRDIILQKDHPATNGLCTVLYPREFLKKLDTHLSTIRISQPMDWEMNDVFKCLDAKVLWGKAITKHGSVLAMENENFDHLKSVLRNEY